MNVNVTATVIATVIVVTTEGFSPFIPAAVDIYIYKLRYTEILHAGHVDVADMSSSLRNTSGFSTCAGPVRPLKSSDTSPR